ncbi:MULTISPECIES: monovalent cation:proton antiporter family protein [Methanosarcina]|uniref:Glutathione-regulated potassium-efflux system protein KefC n=4 Tax=Methanosarcina barkeri TaxID=2208 RepID=A0A0E3QYK8_METBA|nr:MULTISPECIES: monovalent cation:proton antiporter family protein [Methanosarcina]AKB55925.1 Glutathione-regulated potassium-efflux system protein KefC [Methanosarcina barkeri MS]AKB59400.1 Glutathione-regulated potassium-efflux system protein KefC [Methanosarcina barkeri 227]AKJ40074.1 Kef-type potassium/proton antiporter CPA2 family [Methanosarcina barkeri CM1]OED02525.1 potassium transporter KefB [Methanosarcina sp. A14]
MVSSLLANVDVLLGFAILILTIFYRFQVPPVLGFLVTGMLIGPYGLGILNGGQNELNADLGVIFLLFTIGVDLSLKELWKMKKALFLGGTLQILLTIFLTLIICSSLGFNSTTSVFFGFLISLSSTAIVLKVLQDRNEVYTQHGKTSLAILIFQDLAIVPLILITPLLAGDSLSFEGSLSTVFLKGSLVILVFILSAKFLIPYIFYHVGRTGNKELFLVSVVFICLSTALFTSSIGLSLALGAFLAGIVISGSQYSQQAMGNIIPLRDMFMSFFFVSVGMLLNTEYLLDHLMILIIASIALIIIKSIAGVASTFLLGCPLRAAILTGFALSQVGEFSFVLSRLGVEYSLMTEEAYQAFLAVSIITMGVTPFLINASYKPIDFLVTRVSGTTNGLKLIHGLYSEPIKEEEQAEPEMKDHLIIVGFGFSGRTVSKAAKAAGIPYIIVEANPEIVIQEKQKGENIHYGDATFEVVLEHAGVKSARVLIIGISDSTATGKIVEIVKKLNPNICIIAKVRDLQEMKRLNSLGADEIIPEEYETSVEIFVRVLEKYLVPRENIEKLVNDVRANGYRMLRKLSGNTCDDSEFSIKDGLPGVDIQVLKVEDGSSFDGKALEDLNFRKKHGVTVLSVRRGSDLIYTPEGNFILHAKDACILLGKPEDLCNIRRFFESIHG